MIAKFRHPPSTILLAGAIAVIPWMYFERSPTRDTMTDLKWVLDALAIAAFAALALGESPRGEGRDRTLAARAPLFAGAAMALAGLAASSLASPTPSMGSRLALREALFLFFACRLAAGAISESSRATVLFAYAASAATQSAFAIARYLMHAGAAEKSTVRATMLGTLGNPEHVAGWVAPALAISIIWLGDAGISRRMRAALAAIASAIGAFIFLSGGRGAALSVVVALAAANWAAIREACLRMGWRLVARTGSRRLAKPTHESHSGRRWPLAAAGGIVLGLFLLSSIAIGPRSVRQSLVGRALDVFDPHSVSMRHRVGLLAVNSSMIAGSPLLGCGPGRFGVAFDRERGRMAMESESAGVWAFNSILSDQAVSEAHCDPLQWWAEYGALPFLGLMLMLASALACSGGAANSLSSRLIFAALSTMAVGMLFSFPLHRPSRAMLFWALVGMAHAPGANSESKPLDPPARAS